MAGQYGNPADASLAELKAVARLLVDSWNRGDAEAFGRLFTPVAEYVTGTGERIRGRQAIAELLGKAAPATQVSFAGEPVAVCDAGSGELRFMWSSADASVVPRRGTITCTCTRHGHGWLIEALHNDETGNVGESRGSPTRS